MLNASSHGEFLRREFEVRKERNPAYSLRSFAKKLGIHAPVLSEVMNEKKKLPQKYIESVCKALELSATQVDEFKKTIERENANLKELAKRKAIPKKFQLDEKKQIDYKILSDWEYYAVLTLVETSNFQDSNSWIARRLGVSEERAKEVYDLLFKADYLVRSHDKVITKYPDLTSSRNIVSKAIREGHRQTLELAIAKLDIARDLRFYSCNTIAIDKSKILEARELIREFRTKLSDLLSEGNQTEVYNLGIQLFPLSEVETENEC